jgi:hypothetical protein
MAERETELARAIAVMARASGIPEVFLRSLHEAAGPGHGPAGTEGAPNGAGGPESDSDGTDDSGGADDAGLEFPPCDPAVAGGAAAASAAPAGPVDFGAPLRVLVPALLADDARHRVPGVTGGLYSLRDLEGLPRGPLGCGVPVLCMRRGDVEGGPPEVLTPWSPGVFNRAIASDAVFAEEFAAGLEAVGGGNAGTAAAPQRLRGFDLRRHGLVAAGGYPAAVLAGRPETAGDVDLFLVGHPDDGARRAAITALFAHLRRNSSGLFFSRHELMVHRTRGCITFSDSYNGSTVQVVLRAYSTISEVLHGFDLGAAQVAFDGERAFLTAMGVFAATRGANVLNLAVRRVSYEARLVRYLRRGYALVVPDLDPDGFRADEENRLPLQRCAPVQEAAAPGRCRCWCAVQTRDDPASWAGAASPSAATPAAASRAAAVDELRARADALRLVEPRHAIAAGAAILDNYEQLEPALGDYDGVLAADYDGGAIPYGNLGAIAMRNARVLGATHWGLAGAGSAGPAGAGSAGPAGSAGSAGAGSAGAGSAGVAPTEGARDPGALLCAAARTADEDFDVLGFRLDETMIFPSLSLFRSAILDVQSDQAVCLGPDLAGRIRALRAFCMMPGDTLLRRLWEARRALALEALAAVDFGPAAFAPVTEGTALSGDPRFATTPAEWLGIFFAGPAE